MILNPVWSFGAADDEIQEYCMAKWIFVRIFKIA